MASRAAAAFRRARALERATDGPEPTETFLVRQAAMADDAIRALAHHRAEVVSELRNRFPWYGDDDSVRRSIRVDGGLQVVRERQNAVFCECHAYHAAVCPNLPTYTTFGSDALRKPVVHGVRVADRLRFKVKENA
jgi:hypothetical protein